MERAGDFIEAALRAVVGSGADTPSLHDAEFDKFANWRGGVGVLEVALVLQDEELVEWGWIFAEDGKQVSLPGSSVAFALPVPALTLFQAPETGLEGVLRVVVVSVLCKEVVHGFRFCFGGGGYSRT